ncbi:MAG: hypothetical protein U0165_07650 [Polyangiaceae bacterium]
MKLTIQPASSRSSRFLRPLLRTLVVATSLVLGLMATGCVTTPTLALHHAEVSGVGMAGVNVNVIVQVNNKNSFDVMVRNLNANITIADKYPLFPVAFNPNQWLGSKSSSLMSVPVTIPWPMMPGLLAETLGSENIKFHIKGTADVSATRALEIQRNNESIDQDGKISRAMILTAARNSMPGAN